MKGIYETPSVEMLKFSVQDVMATSTGNSAGRSSGSTSQTQEKKEQKQKIDIESYKK